MAITEEAGPSNGLVGPSPAAADRDIAATDEFLMRLITLCASLSGAMIYLLTDVSLGILFRLAMIGLLLALVCALKGRLMAAVEGGQPEALATQSRDLLRRKKRCAELTAAALVLGLCLAAGGVWLRY